MTKEQRSAAIHAHQFVAEVEKILKSMTEFINEGAVVFSDPKFEVAFKAMMERTYVACLDTQGFIEDFIVSADVAKAEHPAARRVLEAAVKGKPLPRHRKVA